MKKIKASEKSQRGLFAHFRDLGLVCDEVKPSFNFRGGSGFVTCSVGYTFHIYSVNLFFCRFDLLFSLRNLN
jgi:hypothetical protein